jgi:hypothetical protein
MAHDSLNPENDPFAPPAISTEVHCIHCGEEYDSYRIEWRIERDADGAAHGFWCCPIEDCDGKGFGFDIFPVDPDYRDENGELMWCSDSDEFEDDQWEDAELIDGEFEEVGGGEAWGEEEAPAKGAAAEPDDDVPY